MVIQKAVDNLKDRSKEERKAVAGGIAIGVVAILFFAWAFFFLKKLQHTNVQSLDTGAQSEFDFQSVKDAQQKLIDSYTGQSSLDEELRTIRDQSSSYQYGQGATQQSVDQNPSEDPFGTYPSGQ